MDISGSGYLRRTDPGTGRPLSERNWVWAVQGAVNVHMPERWGYVWFGERRALPPDESVKWALRQVYYAQRNYHAFHGEWARSAGQLGLQNMKVPGGLLRPSIAVAAALWEAWAEVPETDRTWHIDRYGRIWREEPS